MCHRIISLIFSLIVVPQVHWFRRSTTSRWEDLPLSSLVLGPFSLIFPLLLFGQATFRLWTMLADIVQMMGGHSLVVHLRPY